LFVLFFVMTFHHSVVCSVLCDDVSLVV
jgi:hypothetical protein